MTLRCDVLVVGAGPGGLAAAATAAESGSRVCLVDDNPAAGGQIWRGQAGKPGAARQWLQRATAAGVELRTGLQVVAAPAPGLLRLQGEAGSADIAYGKLILATGARERFLPFPGWTLRGVMGVGAAQAFLKSGFQVAGRRAVVAGTGPLLLAVAAALHSHGATVVAICEQAPLRRLAGFGVGLWRHPARLAEGLRYRLQSGMAPYKTACRVLSADGREQVESVQLARGRSQWRVECDLLACGFHLVPNLELPLLLGCRVEHGFIQVDPMQQSSCAGVFCIGELTGIGGLHKALAEGQAAGWAAAGRPDRAARLAPRLAQYHRFARALDHAFALEPELRTLPQPDTTVCRCEDVSLQQMEPCTGWRDAKLHCRAGMGACQGRVCGAAAEFLFGWQKLDPRPPVYPAAVEDLARDTEE